MKSYANKNQIAHDALSLKRISASRRKELRTAVAFTGKVRKEFERLGLITARSERVWHDLGEIDEVLQSVSSRLRRIMAQPSLNAARTLEMLREIERELFIHLPYHLRLLRRPLERLVEDLEEGRIGKPARRTRRRTEAKRK